MLPLIPVSKCLLDHPSLTNQSIFAELKMFCFPPKWASTITSWIRPENIPPGLLLITCAVHILMSGSVRLWVCLHLSFISCRCKQKICNERIHLQGDLWSRDVRARGELDLITAAKLSPLNPVQMSTRKLRTSSLIIYSGKFFSLRSSTWRPDMLFFNEIFWFGQIKILEIFK